MARAHGIDISKHQVTFDSTVNPDDIQFAIMRVSRGTTTDEKYDEMLAAIASIPIRGAYHYFKSNKPWRDQAEHFLGLVRGKGFHFYALDFEKSHNEPSKEFAQGAEKWLQHVADETGLPTLLYTNPDTYHSWLTPHGNWMQDWPLWIAQYWEVPNRDGRPALPAGVSEWKIWQYSADNPPNNKGAEYGVASDNIDLDVFNGSVQELRRWLNLEPAEDLDQPAEAPKQPVVEPGAPAEADGAVITWREVIEAARTVATRRNAIVFTWFREADIVDQVTNGDVWERPYNGSPVESWPLSPASEREAIQQEILQELDVSRLGTGDMVDESEYTWQAVIEAASAVGRRRQAIFFTWFREAGIADQVLDPSLRAKPYDGLPVGSWKVPVVIRSEILEEIDRRRGAIPVEPAIPDPVELSGGAVKLKVPFISQWDSDAASHTADCGPTCLAMLINAEGAPAKQVSVDALYQDYLPAKGLGEFTSLAEMKRIATGESFEALIGRHEGKAEALEGLRALIRARRPFVALVNYGAWDAIAKNHFRGGHFVLVTGFDQDNVVVHDPLFRGARRRVGKYFTWSNDLFLEGWGTCLRIDNPNFTFLATNKTVPRMQD